MTRRSVNNERNQMGMENKKAGVSRKSASTAKPKRDLASTVYEAPKPKKKNREIKAEMKAKEEKRARRIMARNAAEGRKKLKGEKSPEEKRWIRIWWGALIGVFVLFGVAVIFGGNNRYIFWIMMALAYVEVAFTFYIQFSKLSKFQKQRENVELTRKISSKEYAHLIAKQEEEERLQEEKHRKRMSKIPFFGKKYRVSKDEELDVPLK